MAIGSNAPVITNVLVAWPPPPSSARFGGSSPPATARNTRFSLAAQLALSSPSVSPPSSSTPSFPGASPLGGYATPRSDPSLPLYQVRSGSASASASGSGSSTPVRSRSMKNKESPSPDPEPSRRDYPPPKAPLSPAQLGRIAQSFGIAVPKLSDPASAFSTPSRTATSTPRPSSPNGGILAGPSPVIAVVPPHRLLASLPDEDAASEAERRRRWRRGRLIPLQPTLSAMLVAIAREFGLPSTLGISVYLRGMEDSSRGSTSSMDDDFAGPEITATTWSTVFGQAARKTTASPGTTPISSPRKRNPPAATFGTVLTNAPSELHQQDRVKTLSQSTDARSHSASSDSSLQPRTPASLGTMSMAPFGTIEFDIDLTEARWFDEWIKAGGSSRRMGPGAEIVAIRELTLVERLKDPRPKFLRQMDEERERAERSAAERVAQESLEATRLAAEREENARREAQQLQVEQEEAEREAALQAHRDALAAQRMEEQLEKEEIEERLGAEQPAEPAEIGTREVPNGSAHGSPLPDNIQIEDVDKASINSRSPVLPPVSFNQSPVSPGMLSPKAVNDNRASGIVMADQLSTLEKMVRDLQPKEIRYNPNRQRPGDARSPSVRLGDLPARGSSRLPYLVSDSSAEGRPSTDSSGSTPPITPSNRSEWPAVSYKAVESPVQEFFNKGGLPPHASNDSHRLQSAESAHRATRYGGSSISSLSGGPPPKRPARPPTPDLTMPDTIPHVLPSEYVDAIKTPTSASSPVFPSRPVSMSIKAIRRQTSHKNLRPKERAHAYAVANTREFGHPREASTTSTASRGSVGSPRSPTHSQYMSQQFPVSEFGSPVEYDSAQHGTSLPASRKDGGFTSRFFSFGGRKPRENDENRMTIMHISSPIATTVKHVHVTPADLAASGAAGGLTGPVSPPPLAAASPTTPASASTPTAPRASNLGSTVVGFSTPNPSASTLGPNDLRMSDDGQRSSLPNSPTSPRHVRRKPVPGIGGERDSQYSINSLPSERHALGHVNPV